MALEEGRCTEPNCITGKGKDIHNHGRDIGQYVSSFHWYNGNALIQSSAYSTEILAELAKISESLRDEREQREENRTR